MGKAEWEEHEGDLEEPELHRKPQGFRKATEYQP